MFYVMHIYVQLSLSSCSADCLFWHTEEDQSWKPACVVSRWTSEKWDTHFLACPTLLESSYLAEHLYFFIFECARSSCLLGLTINQPKNPESQFDFYLTLFRVKKHITHVVTLGCWRCPWFCQSRFHSVWSESCSPYPGKKILFQTPAENQVRASHQ